ncbi:MAG: hypothetical protein RDV48_21565 [Candidatus Eremiobacteraeota bacterium]|nr:hypothetical protein [Candidatus Eremiobacteraeota bacterium]
MPMPAGGVMPVDANIVGEIPLVAKESDYFQFIVAKTHFFLVPLVRVTNFVLLVVPFALLGGFIFSYIGGMILGNAGASIMGGVGGVLGGLVAFKVLDVLLVKKKSVDISRADLKDIYIKKDIEKVPLKELTYINLNGKLLTFSQGNRMFTLIINEPKYQVTCDSMLVTLAKQHLVIYKAGGQRDQIKQMEKQLRERKKK